MARSYCDHCRESFDEDNLVECSRCGHDVCYRCVVHAEVPEGAAASWWCDRCLKAIGREDILRKAIGKPEYHPPDEKLLAIVAMRRMGLVDETGSIRWPNEESERAVLARWLELVGKEKGSRQ